MIWLVLRLAGGLVFKTLEGLGDISWHRKVHFSIFIIPFQSNSEIPCSSMVNCDFIMLLETVEQVLLVLLSHVLHAEVVNAEGEGNWAPLV